MLVLFDAWRTPRIKLSEGHTAESETMGANTFEVKQERVIAAAADLFARKGCHGTGIAELGKAVGLGKGALYHYIASKEAILYEISKSQVDSMNDYAECTLAAYDEPEELMREMARGLLRNIADHQAQGRCSFAITTPSAANDATASSPLENAMRVTGAKH